MLRFRWAGLSHVGLVRDNNEDSGFAGPYLLLVADGVGGAAAGEVASASTTYVTATVAMAADPDRDALDLLAEAATRSHMHLRDGVAADPARSGMATTLTALFCDGRRIALGHIGDSRGYLQRRSDGRLIRLTTDHTLVQQLIDTTGLSLEEAAVHPLRSVVLRSIEAEQPPEPDLAWLDVDEGDRVLLCSDGLTDLVAEDQIAGLLDTADVDDAAACLVDAALAAGGRDNITCVVADVIDGPRIRSDGMLLGAVTDLDNLIDPAAVRLPDPA